MTGLRFLFRVTLRRHDLAAEIYHLKEPQKVPMTLNTEETKRLLAMAGSVRDRLMLSLGYGAGLRSSEILRLQGQAYRQRADGHSRRAVEGPQGPAGDAVAGYARSAERMVEGAAEGERHRHSPTGAPAVPKLHARSADDDPQARATVPENGSGGRHLQDGDGAHAAAFVRDTPVRSRCRYQDDPGIARTRQVGDDGTLRTCGNRSDHCRRQPA